MQKSTLFLIPDISGFTKFVKRTEVLHGQHIISELLEVLIDSNELGLTLSEIEGDALLFYKQGSIPGKKELVKQSQSMFTKFHQHLRKYQGHRICECGACRGAGNLTLKIITHVGPVGFITVKGQQKPYGEDVILAHRLLKNNIDSKEYLLISNSFMEQGNSVIAADDFPWLDLKQGSTEYESLGKIDYHYGSLAPLHQLVTDAEVDVSKPLKSDQPVVVETYIDRPGDEVFEIIIDFEQRMKWNKFAKEIEYDPDRVNQVGAKHVCVFDSQTIEFESVTADFGNNSLVYGEKILDTPAFAKDITLYFIVGRQDVGCRVQLQAHYSLKPLTRWIMAPIFRYKTRKLYNQVLQHLKQWCEDSSSIKKHHGNIEHRTPNIEHSTQNAENPTIEALRQAGTD